MLPFKVKLMQKKLLGINTQSLGYARITRIPRGLNSLRCAHLTPLFEALALALGFSLITNSDLLPVG